MLKMISVAALALASTAASAATIVYNVNQTVGLGSVVGSIETNGTLGTLAASDVTAFSLTVSGVGASVVLTQADSVIVENGGNLSATATGLFYNYAGPSGFLVFQKGSFGTGQSYYCNASADGACFQGASAVPQSFNSASAQYEPRSGLQQIAGNVPEPASWALMIAGFGLVGTTMRRRTVSAATPT